MQLARAALKDRIEHLNRLIVTSQSAGAASPRSSLAAAATHARHLGILAITAPPPNMSAVRLAADHDDDDDCVPEAGLAVRLREKDAEIAELRARLDDKDRMLAALRSAARKRDQAEQCVATRRASQASSAGDRRSLARAAAAANACF